MTKKKETYFETANRQADALGYSLKVESPPRWKKEPPTEEGWFWVGDSKFPKQEPIVVKVYRNKWDDNRWSVDIWDMSIKTRVEDEGDLWLGPLPVPELPKG